jgi:hypothetical protein
LTMRSLYSWMFFHVSITRSLFLSGCFVNGQRPPLDERHLNTTTTASDVSHH